ncbi:MAG TPA: response regulator [Terriglobales bacterium]|jgi:CheY-like chemotaxis protein|nr:response regulator [Terriglobales bacterium]
MSAPPALGSPPTLLCIDDQESALKIRKLFLEAQGYKVLIASSGREGLELLKAHPLDAVILDYRMPEMDGAEVAERMQQTHPALPIIVLSGYVADLPERLKSIARGFVAKGGSPAELLNILAEVLGGQPLKRPPKSAEVLAESAEQVERSKRVVSENLRRLEERKRVSRKA